MTVAYHYKLHAYVCAGGRVLPSVFEGWATCKQIYASRPNNCRFAIVQPVPLRNHQGKIVVSGRPEGDFMVWDIVPLTKRPLFLNHKQPEPITKWSGPSLDGMIMKAVMLYDQD